MVGKIEWGKRVGQGGFVWSCSEDRRFKERIVIV